MIRTLPRVYALGYRRDDRAARVWDALLFAGPKAGLTGACAAFELGLLFYEPPEIKVVTPRNCRSPAPGVTVLGERPFERAYYQGIPHACLPELLLELAVEGNVPILRRALEALDYQRKLDVAAAHRICCSGRRGSRLLKQALANRLPQLAHCRSVLEVDFLVLLDDHHRLLPAQVNQKVHGILADMYWPELNLIVELDGQDNHGTGAQKRRDAGRDEVWASHGITVIRLTYADVHASTAHTLERLAARGVR